MLNPREEGNTAFPLDASEAASQLAAMERCSVCEHTMRHRNAYAAELRCVKTATSFAWECEVTGKQLAVLCSAPTQRDYDIGEVGSILLLRTEHSTRGVFLYVDLHGHSRKKNIFMYTNTKIPLSHDTNTARGSLPILHSVL